MRWRTLLSYFQNETYFFKKKLYITKNFFVGEHMTDPYNCRLAFFKI